MTFYEKQAIDLARQESFCELRKNIKAKYEDCHIDVKTKYNSGIVFGDGKKFSNKCFFISLCDGLKSYGIRTLIINGNVVEITSFNLMKIANFMNTHELVDTDIKEHMVKLHKLVSALKCVHLLVYFGNKKGDIWTTSPDTLCTPIGNGDLPIRILNKNKEHFELISSKASKFVPHMTINPLEIIKHQAQTFTNISDNIYYVKKIEEIEKKIKKDEEYAIILQIEDDAESAKNMF